MDNQQPIQNQPEIIIPQSKTNYFKLIFFSVLGVLFVSAIVYLYLQNQTLKKQMLNPPVSPTVQVPSPTSKPSSSISIPPDETAGWKTYTNSKYSFSFKYPNNFGDQGVIAGPFTGTSIAVRSFSDPKTIREGTDANFDGFSVYVITDMKVNSFDQYISNELQLMNSYEYSRMQGATKQTLTNGIALVTDTQGYYYLPTPDKQIIIVLVYLQANTTFKQTFDQILSTFKFLDKNENLFCGGFAGAICPEGYYCKYDGNYPDASGICIKN